MALFVEGACLLVGLPCKSKGQRPFSGPIWTQTPNYVSCRRNGGSRWYVHTGCE